MFDFYYQIKGKDASGNWHWPPLHSGLISAETRKDARDKIEEEFRETLPMTGLKGEKGKEQQFLLSIDDVTNKHYILDRFKDMQCKECGATYTLNHKYLLHAGGQREFCSSECADKFKNAQGIVWDVNFDFTGQHAPVIYKITCKAEDKCYIGKTTQAFTLRWYQHFYQGHGTKFHEAIKKYGMAGWTFEVIEIIEIPKDAPSTLRHTIILERESFWINHYDSIDNGYNTVISKKERIEELELQGKLFLQ